MEKNYFLRHQIIQNLLQRSSEKDEDSVFILWEQIAVEIISIISEDGFNSIYERSEFLTQKTFPWLMTNPRSTHPDERFLKLKICFKSQIPALRYEANLLLLKTFTDILALLIGEQLTLRILNSAWDIDFWLVSGKEFKDEQ